MPVHLSCPHGHDWDLPADALAGPVNCPVCGEPAQTLPPDPPGTTGPQFTAMELEPRRPAPGAGPVTVPGYEILGELGRGGMGVVYQARQTALGRLVALKMILAGPHAGAEELDRFRAEAEAAARMQHPNIVQIHDVGEHRGLPYFSLEFVEGGSLAQRLRGRPQAPRDCAALLEVLARAVHYAHQRGILHRDLKPGNILLARSPKAPPSAPGAELLLSEYVPKVGDFGLAKRLEGGEGLTRSGATLGTPGYMAPEQASGVTKTIGPPADVYALGAILYECLTGRPPFIGPTPVDTVLQSLSQEPVPPRRLQPKVPRDLETICLKCLHKDPRKRYAGADALADDLHRFLDGRPILARPVGPLERLGRWCRRRPVVAGLLAALVLSVAGGFTGVTWAWLETAASRQRERDEAAKKERNSQLARATNISVVDLANELKSLTGTQARTVHRILKQASDNYERLLRETGESPELLAGKAGMLNSFAEVYRAINDSTRSVASAREAIALWQRLLEQDEGNRAWRIGLAQSRQHLGIGLALQGDSGEALAAFRDAEAVLRPLAGPDDPQAQSHLAMVLAQLGQLRQMRGEEREGEDCFREALALREQLARRPDARAVWRRDLAASQQRIADLLWARGEYEPAEKLYAESLRLIERVVREEPEDAEWQADLVRAHWSMGFVHERHGDGKAALAEYEKSVALARPFTLQDPGNVQWQQRLLRGHRKSTDVFVNPDELTRARILEAFRQRAEATRQDLALTEKLGRGDPANAELKRRAAELRRELAVNLAALGRLGEKPRENLDEAITVLGPARAALAELARRDPADVTLVNGRFLVASALSDALRAQGKEREARQASLDGALIQLEAALARARHRPDDPRAQTELLAARFQVATARTLLATVDAEPQRQYQAALEPLAQARAGYERLHEREPDNRAWLERLSILYFEEATTLRQLGRDAEASPLEAKAKGARERLQQLRAQAPAPLTPPSPPSDGGEGGVRGRSCSISAVALDLISRQALIRSMTEGLTPDEVLYLLEPTPARALDVVAACRKLGLMLAAVPTRETYRQARRVLQRGRHLLHGLEEKGALGAEQKRWPSEIDDALRRLGPGPEQAGWDEATRQPYDQFDYPRLIDLFLGAGRPGELVALLDREAALPWSRSIVYAVALEPKRVRAVVKAAREELEDDPEALGAAGRRLVAALARAVGDREAAAEFDADLLKERPDDVLAVKLYYHLSGLGRHREAAAALVELGERAEGKQRWQVWTNLAFTYLRIEDLASAADAVEKAAAVDAKAPQILLLRGQVGYLSFLQRRFRQARRQYQALLEQKPPAATALQARYFLSLIYDELGEADKAEEEGRKFLAESPQKAGAGAVLAYLLASAGRNLDEAEELARAAHKASPADPVGRLSLGLVLCRRDHVAEGLPLLEAALSDKVLSESPTVRALLGDAYLKAGRPDRAGACWRRALRLFPPTTEPDDRRRAEVRRNLRAIGWSVE